MIIQTIPVGPLEVNCYITGDSSSGDVFIIDPGDEIDRILSAIRKNSYTVKALINTHGHLDHAGGVQRLKDELLVPYYIHEEEKPLLEALPLQQTQFGLYLSGVPEPDDFLVHGQILTAGKTTYSVIHTPGHSPGGICLYTEGCLFSGDTLFAGSVGRYDLPGGSQDALDNTIRTHLLVLPDETKVYPGHGPASTIGRERRYNPFLRRFRSNT
jgi:hydroxyacylglutathione hydrolase